MITATVEEAGQEEAFLEGNCRLGFNPSGTSGGTPASLSMNDGACGIS